MITIQVRGTNWSTMRYFSGTGSASKRQLVDVCPPPTYDTGCTYCKVEFPPDKQIDFTRPLNGTKSALWKHALIPTTTRPSEWPSKIELVPGSLAAEMSQYRKRSTSPTHPIMISNINIPIKETSNLSSVFLYPNKQLIQFDIKHTEEFLKVFMNPIEGSNETTPNIDLDKFKVSQLENELVLICGHTKRDERCGHIAPFLSDEFTKVLARKNLLYHPVDNPKGLIVGIISHIGGHVYAGNVIYFNKMGESFWYGRVFPENVQGIVQETIEGGNIVKELYRGFL